MTTTVTVQSVQVANGAELIPLSLLLHLHETTHTSEVPETVVS